MTERRSPFSESGLDGSGFEAPSARLARQLSEQSEPLDQLSRARYERSLLQAWRTRSAAAVDLPASGGSRAGRLRKLRLGLSLAATAVAGAAAAFLLFGTGTGGSVGPGEARFELRIGDAAVQRGTIAEGQTLESGRHGRIDLDLGAARVDMAAHTELRLARLSATELALSLAVGRVAVDFHPVERGRQTLLIESKAALVRVIGTRFTVEVDELGNTDVGVQEGVVEVTPRSGAPARRLTVGERLQVRADDGDAYERAVRTAIESRLGREQTAAPVPDMDFTDPALGVVDGVEDELLDQDEEQSVARLEQELGEARRLLRQGRHAAARARLQRLGAAGMPLGIRLEALTLVAESYTAQAQIPRARKAYERAARVGQRHSAGHNAQFALGRLLERYTQDRAGAVLAYEGYLLRAPRGALAAQAHGALCRLGQAGHCQ
ncbi:MAG: FecR domain-containing protein [Myxococcales bacterium]|nr:FecR domain-containing protein [Myxococcales bacterium]